MKFSNAEQTKRMLMDMTSRIIAREGFNRATTKNIAEQCGVSEVYIYRLFKDKDDLLLQTFLDNDLQLRSLLLLSLPILKDESMPLKDRVRTYYFKALDLMLSVPDDAVAYLRFFYSAKYLDLARSEHENCYKPVVKGLSELFKSGIDTAFLLRYTFESLLTVVYNISIGRQKLTDELREWIFEMNYNQLLPYIKEEYINN